MDPYDKAVKLQDKLAEGSFEALSEVEQVLLCVVELEAEINNGGFTQYYCNSAGELANFAPTALDRIGASATAEIVQAANAPFGANVPADMTERQNRLEELEVTFESVWEELDQRFYDYPDDIAHLLSAFLTKHCMS